MLVMAPTKRSEKQRRHKKCGRICKLSTNPKTMPNKPTHFRHLSTTKCWTNNWLVNFSQCGKRNQTRYYTLGLDMHSKLQKILLLGALPHFLSTFRTTQNSSNRLTLIDLPCKYQTGRNNERTPNSTPSIAIVAYKNKRFNQRGEISKSWIRKVQTLNKEECGLPNLIVKSVKAIIMQ